ncbi:hypothetical protein Gal_04338 (plasmid) [Phaeobacter gallaeciensis DSM 26640]|uniref:Uncharacterized protein n=1 Tax=Phaeobacter gallaeciensis TaxID=60890 RepID=A0AAC9ZDI3_9RHOB|nr:hypothetical protein Gal_04338 [Phaeobacter gallaeciensis DSM 26640]ATE99525.1 hypothetical protein PhaeoP73_04265 [Phaeobacter gallaeciensis]ATF08115.1 hypothetical protein PhaeoP63_04084 [Phaeobacter gallaeciensis]
MPHQSIHATQLVESLASLKRSKERTVSAALSYVLALKIGARPSFALPRPNLTFGQI